MAEPFDTIAAAIADIIARVTAGTLAEADAALELAPLLVDLAPPQWEQLAKVIQVLGRVEGQLFTDGPPADTLGAIGSTAVDMAAKIFYGPKTALGWGAGEAFVGATGPSGTITAVSVVTGAIGSDASIALGGTPQARTIQFTIPRGNTGPSGTITSASALTGAPGASVSVALGGTPEARTMEFTIPRGDTGAGAEALNLFASADRYNLVDDTKRNSFMAKGVELLFTSGSYRAGLVAAASLLALPGAVYTRAGAATAEMANGAIVNFAANVPRITDKGQLVEPASTNLIVNSVFANTGGVAPTNWNQPIGTGVSAPAASTRNSGVSAWSQSATAQRPMIQAPSITFATNTTYQIHMIVEDITGGLLAIDLLRLSTTPAGATTTFPACSANPTGGATGVVQPGLLVMQVVFTTTGGSLATYYGIGANGNATGTIRFSCPTVEAQAAPTSFIPTTTAAATRAADVPYLSVDLPSAFSAILEFERTADPASQFPAILTVSGSPYASTDFAQVFLNTDLDQTRLTQRGGNVAGASVSIGSCALNTVARCAATFSSTSYRGSGNGIAVVGATAQPSMVAARSLLHIGHSSGAGAVMGYIRSIIVFPFTLTDDEVQALANLSTAPSMALAKTMDATLDLMARASLYGITDISQALGFARTGVEAIFTTPYYRKGLLGGASPNAISLAYTRAGEGTALTLAGAMTTFAANALRRTDRGVLIEEARTNLFVRSREFDNASWAKSAGGTGVAPIVTANAAVAPDGTMTADQIVFDQGAGGVTGDQSFISQVAAFTGGATYAASIWLRSNTPCTLLMRGVADSLYTVLNVTTAWTRFWVAEVAASGAMRVGLRGATASSQTATVEAWEGQLELGASPSSNIPTTTAAATRAADNPDAPLAAPPTAIFLQARPDNLVASMFPLDLHNGTSNERIFVNIATNGSISASVVNGGVTTTIGTSAAGAIVAGATFKVALRRNAAGTWRMFLNGAAVGVETAAVALPSVTTMSLGRARTNAAYLNGYLEKVVPFPIAPTDAQLIALTT